MSGGGLLGWGTEGERERGGFGGVLMLLVGGDGGGWFDGVL